jgi:predicted O-methyltransferase YrrM
VEFLQTFGNLVQHRISAIGRHGAHSPFVFELIENVFNPKHKKNVNFNAAPIEKIRDELLHNQTILEVIDLGAGSKVLKSNKRKIADIAKVSLKKPKEALLLLRLAKFLNSKVILELGTSFGLTTLYLAETSIDCKVYTLEGCPSILSIAKENFKKIDVENITTLPGNFNVTLPQIIKNLNTVDLVLFDGNHAKQPTLDYFNAIIEKTNENSVFIFDDINWSLEMKDAWQQICKHPKVTLTIDCWKLGMVFFHKNRVKQHFNINY